MIASVRYLILGAGPSGLACAHALLDAGVEPGQVLVVEREAVAGGLCRSEQVDGAPLDIGGGHFLDLKRREVLDLLFRFLPESEWVRYDRVSKISLHGHEIDHPLESNLWQLPKNEQVEYLESIAEAGCLHGDVMPDDFSSWIAWKLGDRIANEYMLPYNRKIWSMPLSDLGTYWLHKLPNVSFRDTLRSCLEGRPFGELPAHGSFLYPRAYGYGEVWRRMGVALGDRLVTGCALRSIDFETRIVNDRWKAETIISTIPWSNWIGRCDLPFGIERQIEALRHIAIDVDYHAETLDTTAHWTYEPREDLAYHRILVRSNFCPGARGYWTETNASRARPPTGVRHHNEFAYPVNTIGKPKVVRAILEWARNADIIGLGRWGTWEHMNSDVAVAEAVRVGKDLALAEAST